MTPAEPQSPRAASALADMAEPVTEAMNAAGELLGHGRLEDFLAACTDRSHPDVPAAVSAGIDEFAADAEQADDIAMLAWSATAATG